MNSTTATVETLTAEVRVLMVANRQITLSVARQLDRIDWPWGDPPLSEFTPFGRVRTGSRVTATRRLNGRPLVVDSSRHDCVDGQWTEDFQTDAFVEVIGRLESDHSLALLVAAYFDPTRDGHEWAEEWATIREWHSTLPLIVLAGLR